MSIVPRALSTTKTMAHFLSRDAVTCTLLNWLLSSLSSSVVIEYLYTHWRHYYSPKMIVPYSIAETSPSVWQSPYVATWWMMLDEKQLDKTMPNASRSKCYTTKVGQTTLYHWHLWHQHKNCWRMLHHRSRIPNIAIVERNHGEVVEYWRKALQMQIELQKNYLSVHSSTSTKDLSATSNHLLVFFETLPDAHFAIVSLGTITSEWIVTDFPSIILWVPIAMIVSTRWCEEVRGG